MALLRFMFLTFPLGLIRGILWPMARLAGPRRRSRPAEMIRFAPYALR